MSVHPTFHRSWETEMLIVGLCFVVSINWVPKPTRNVDIKGNFCNSEIRDSPIWIAQNKRAKMFWRMLIVYLFIFTIIGGLRKVLHQKRNEKRNWEIFQFRIGFPKFVVAHSILLRFVQFLARSNAVSIIETTPFLKLQKYHFSVLVGLIRSILEGE